MEYAKIKDGAIVKYPYTQDDLLSENPYTNFSNGKSLSENYIGTEASQDGSFVIDVKMNRPDFNLDSQQATHSEMPVYKNNACVFEWIISDLPVRVDLNGDGT